MAHSPAIDRRTRRFVGWGTGAVLGNALLYIGLNDPHRPGLLFPPCPFHELTGWLCPGCGGLRMTHHLLHGDLAAAFVDNAFVLIGLPLLLAWVLTRRGQHKPVATVALYVVTAITVVAWTLVRNLPGFPLVPTVLAG